LQRVVSKLEHSVAYVRADQLRPGGHRWLRPGRSGLSLVRL